MIHYFPTQPYEAFMKRFCKERSFLLDVADLLYEGQRNHQSLMCAVLVGLSLLTACGSTNDCGFDSDGDGLRACEDCNDADASNRSCPTPTPSASETPSPTPIPPGSPIPTPGCDQVDVDRDGFNACIDCNDSNESVYPGAAEVCNGQDNDCDGGIPSCWGHATWGVSSWLESSLMRLRGGN